MEKYLRETDAVQTVMEKPDMTPDEKAGIIRRLKAIPAADVVEVVRCRDCIYLEKDSKFDMTGDGNEDARFCGNIGCCTNDDWFCADGKRDDGGQ